jgi:murein DD-endopeptidase MepM/ murein hydrolase activator NlpD
MRQASFWSGFGRGALALVAAACVALGLAGCSSTSRFDYPIFNLTSSDSGSNADLASTSALPPVLPEESVYGSANPPDAKFARANLPPPSYSPAPSRRVRAHRANYPAQASPQIKPAAAHAGQGPGRTIKVQQGDTLSSLSRHYGVPVETIMSANSLPDGHLATGQELFIPGASAAKVAAASPAPAPKPKTANPAPAADVTTNDASASDASPPASGGTSVRVVKTTTILPPGASSLAEEEEGEASAKPAAKQGAGDVAASPEITGEEKPRLASTDQLPTPDPMSGNSFRWPVKGRVISQFGARPDGGHNDGIDVAVPQGTQVKAAENGVVAYAGSELKGYGNLVLIRHANNWVSAYAHNEEILVKRGDKVSRGQVIAKAGATGAVSQPLVHFELRKGSRPVDPTKYMSDQAANAE